MHKPTNHNQMRSMTESDRSAEFISARAEMIIKVDDMFASLEKARNELNRPFKFGGAVFGIVGIERSSIPNPFDGFSLMTEQIRSSIGLYVGHDEPTGHDVILLNRPDKSSVEIRRDAILESVILPESLSEAWAPRPQGVNSVEPLVSFMETQEDGGSLGYTVTAGGGVIREQKVIGTRILSSMRPIAPNDAESIHSALMILDLAQQDFFIDNK